jgi:hypothetical protein
MEYTRELELSLRYLNSETARDCLRADPYWPKWDSPWWHMLLLHEMGLTAQIPDSIVLSFVESINRLPIKIFPLHPSDVPSGIDPSRESACHCQLGTVYQVLSTRGIDVDREVPWIRPWLLRYQMPDGGLSCDNEAYEVKDETPSSMAGTISAFEAILLHTPRPWTDEEDAFLQKAAAFLIGRKLMLGSSTKHNAEERVEAEEWLKPCFPRFYFYDVLRGLAALLTWSQKTGAHLPTEAIGTVVEHLNGLSAKGGKITNARLSYEDCTTWQRVPTGEWRKQRPATIFPLLSLVSQPGKISPFLSRQWDEARGKLSELRIRDDRAASN